ncbi:MAG: IS1182 family transposase [Faecalibacterium sp.]|nr:IS1182 family transposase [Faecalibacterium sp.]MDY5503988.1 IS1182 family transposase [Faecalibacterium sp.]
MKQIQQKEYSRKAALYQQLALPIAENIEIAENEPVFVANAQLEELDYRELYRAYSPKGRKSAAEPRIMFKLLVYGYMNGIYSTRKLEQACRKNIDFIWLLQGEHVPDHSSFARFRSGKARQAIEDLFYQFVKRLAAEQEIEYEEVFIDGTKIESMANRYTFVWRKSVDKQLAKVKAKAKELFCRYGGTGNLTTGKLQSLARSLVPEGGEMVHGTGRRKPSWQRQYEEIDQLLERWKKYEAQLFEMGCRRNSLSKTDKDATFMRMKEDHMGNGQLKPAYNVQLAVNSEYITGVAAFPNCTDSGTLIPFLNHIQRMQGSSYRDIVADAGYESVGNYLYLQAHGQNGYIKPTNYEIRKTRKYQQQIWRMENMQYLEREDCFVCAAGRKLRLHRTSSKKEDGMVTTCSYYRCEGCTGCPLREQCTKSKVPDFCKEVKVCEEFAQCRAQAHQRLVTERGALLRMNRSIQVEGAFGVLKSNRKFKRFLMRGRTNISLELFLLCLAYNLKKYWSKLQHDRLKSHLFPLKKE